ncbi:MAG: hypothetical protein GXO35_05805 [Gammaproteobacteria bacterium]|nr:hypothetical protein [Gammaproteobacteria bacterium]
MLFWDIIFNNIGTVPGWSFGGILIYLGFSELFFAITSAFFGAATRFHALITNGRLDVYLIRPVDPRALVFAMTFRIEYIIRVLPSVLFLFAYGWALNQGLNFIGLITGIILASLAALVLALLQLTGSYLGFWIGSMKAVEEFTQALIVLTQYPTTIMGPWLRAILTFVFPIGYAATEPALLTVSNNSIFPSVLAMSGMLVGWLALSELTWRKGLGQYESYGG